MLQNIVPLDTLNVLLGAAIALFSTLLVEWYKGSGETAGVKKALSEELEDNYAHLIWASDAISYCEMDEKEREVADLEIWRIWRNESVDSRIESFMEKYADKSQVVFDLKRISPSMLIYTSNADKIGNLADSEIQSLIECYRFLELLESETRSNRNLDADEFLSKTRVWLEYAKDRVNTAKEELQERTS